jgi:hypothetical protein
MKKPKKIDVDSKQFVKEAANLALGAVSIIQCKDCSHPVIEGCCCGFCGSDDPRHKNYELVYVQL